MDKVIKEMEENKNIIIDGKFVYELEQELQRARAEKKELERKYADVLKLAKENADSNEYCLQELEKENERLNEEKGGMQILIDNYIALTEKYHQALQEIRDIVREGTETRMLFADEKSFCDFCKIQAKINEIIGAE